MQNVIAFNKTRALPTTTPNHAGPSAEVVLLMTPDQMGYGYMRAKVRQSVGDGYVPC